ncbi:unnamed protein product [Calypogeia fissa]
MAGIVRFVARCLVLSACAKVVTAQICDDTDNAGLQFFDNDFVFSGRGFETWIPGTNCCNWKGVKCDTSGKVVSLSIENCR